MLERELAEHHATVFGPGQLIILDSGISNKQCEFWLHQPTLAHFPVNSCYDHDCFGVAIGMTGSRHFAHSTARQTQQNPMSFWQAASVSRDNLLPVLEKHVLTIAWLAV